LSFDSNDLLDLKKKTCNKLNSNSCAAVLFGIKSKMNLLKGALMKKHSELKIEVSKTFSDIIITNNPSSNTLVTNNLVNSTNWSIQTSANTSSSSAITVKVKSLVLFFCFSESEARILYVFQGSLWIL
jgi:hypothetical protein